MNKQTMIIVGVVGLLTTLATNKLFKKLNNKTKEKEEETFEAMTTRINAKIDDINDSIIKMINDGYSKLED